MRRVPFIPQYNSTECGVCVITVMLHYYKAFHSIKDIREHLSTGRDGVSIRALINTFKFYGVDAKAFRGDVLEVDGLSLPAIITWENNHFVILEQIKGDFAIVVDSKIGRIKLPIKEFKEKFSGIVILLSLTKEFKRIKRHYNTKVSFSVILKNYKKGILCLIILSFLVQFFSISIPIILQNYIDDSIAGTGSGNVFFLIAVIIFNAIFMYGKQHSLTMLGINIDRDANKMLINKILKVPYRFFDQKSNSEVYFAFENISCVRSIYLENIIGSFFNVLAIIFILIYLFQVNISGFLVVTLILIPNILFLLFSDKPIRRDNRLMIKEQQEVSGHQIEVVNSILGIKSSAIEKFIFFRWIELYDKFFKMAKKYQIKLNAFQVVLLMLITLSPVIVLIYTFSQAQEGSMTFGASIAFYIMSDLLFRLIYNILNAIRNLRDNLVALERIEDIMQYESENVIMNTNDECLNGGIEVRGVSFKYSKWGEDVLKNISCSIPQNSKVAVIGSSGSGKSTFLKVLAGLYKYSEGIIIFDGIRLSENTDATIKAQIGFVAQDIRPMNVSIEEYLISGIDKISSDDVVNACKIVNIHDEITKMPMGYQTAMSENGRNISGGQCQRIVLARMVLLNPKVVLLDEATSALDIVNETKILEYFYDKHCTVIMITHRLEFLKACDIIFVMKDGVLVSNGKYEDVSEMIYTVI